MLLVKAIAKAVVRHLAKLIACRTGDSGNIHSRDLWAHNAVGHRLPPPLLVVVELKTAIVLALLRCGKGGGEECSEND